MEEDEPTCGRGLAQASAVPAGLASVAAGLAENLEVHLRALDLSDTAAVQEQETYESIARSLHSAAVSLRTAAVEMHSAESLPVAAHDMAAMTTPEIVDAFGGYVTAADNLRQLLEAERSDNELMLAAIRTEVQGPDSGPEDLPSTRESPNVAAALALPRALEGGVHGDALRPLYAETVVSIEHPNPISPRGSTSDLDHIVATSTAGAALLSSQRYAIRDVHEIGDLVIFRYTWTGVVAQDQGPFRSGQELTAQVAAFATITNGRISHFETYDCFEPFGEASP